MPKKITRTLHRSRKLYTFGAMLLLVIASTIISFGQLNHAQAACTNAGARGQIEADFIPPVNGNYTVWVQAKGPSSAVLYGGVQGKGDCVAKTVTSLNTTNWTWAAVTNPIALAAATTYQLNLSTDTAGVSMQTARLLNNECNPNLNNGCADETSQASTNTAPVVSAVTQTTASPQDSGNLVFNVTVTDNSGVSSVQLFNGSTLAGSMTKTSTANQYTYTVVNVKAGTYTYTVKATDNGSPALTTTSTPLTVAVASAATPTPTPTPAPVTSSLTNGTFDDKSFSYSSGWKYAASGTGENKYGGSDYYSSQVGATATIKFKGTDITVYGAKAPWHGKFKVQLDNNAATEIDEYNATRIDQTPIYTATKLANAEHTLVFTVAGTKNSASAGTYVSIDKATISTVTTTTSTPTTTSLKAGTYDDDKITSFSNYWNVNGNAAGENKYGGKDHWNMTPGATATIKFYGTGITLYGAKDSFMGIWNVTLDGAARANADMYNRTRQDTVQVLNITGLPAGEHTLTVKNSGGKNASSSNIVLSLDKFVIY